MGKFKPTEQDIEYIKDNYMNKTAHEIAEILGCSDSFVKKIGKTVSNGNKPRKRYHCNEDYFDVIDTYEKAYWLGFIMADGCVYSRENHEALLRICLNNKDCSHLEKFRYAIGGNHKIHMYKRNNEEYCHVTIVSEKMCSDLRKFGCFERKSGKINFPDFNNNELSWGFIHGYIDGDGSISIIKDKNVFRYNLSIVGNYELIKGIYDFILQFNNTEGHIYEDNRGYSFKMYRIVYERMEYLNLIFTNTYKRNIIYLDRKYERVEKYYKEKYDVDKEYYNKCRPE